MTRYFGSHVVGRPLETGGRSFIFEPVEPMGGSWLGVLAVDDESAASVLAESQGAFEITAERFAGLKKKLTTQATGRDSAPLRTPQPPAQPLVGNVAHVVRPGTGPDGSAGDVVETKAGVVLASVELLTTALKPPAEPLIDTMGPKRRKAA